MCFGPWPVVSTFWTAYEVLMFLEHGQWLRADVVVE